MISMQPNAFDVMPRRKRLSVFKLGKLWVFKQFFDNRALFDVRVQVHRRE